MRSLFVPFGLAALLTQPLFAAAQALAPPPITMPQSAPTAAVALTLASAIDMAFQQNPGLRAAARELEISASQRSQAGVRPNPELSFLTEGLQKDRRTTTVQVSQAIELGGKRGARIAAAERDREIASADLAIYRNNLRADVITAFFEVLAAQERLALARTSQQLSQRASEAASRRVSAGRISPVEETRARVAEASTRIELSQASNELAASKGQLAATWGSTAPSFDQVETPQSPVRTYPTTGQLTASLPEAPQFKRARMEVDRQNAQADLERSKQTPNLTLSLGSKRDEQSGQRQTIVGLSIPIPFFDRNQGNLLSALQRTDQARDELLAVQSKLSVELTRTSLRLDAANSELAIIRSEILPGAQSANEAAIKGFELGKFSFLDVLDAQRTLVQAKTQYVRALAESHRANADIERLLGQATSSASTVITP